MQETFASKVREGLDTSVTELDRELKNVPRDSGKKGLLLVLTVLVSPLLVKELRNRKVIYKRDRKWSRGCIVSTVFE